MHQMLTVLTHWPPALIYLVAAALVGGETATLLGLVVPAEAALLFTGFLCYGGRIRLAVALPVLLVAALVGDGLGYLEGRRMGARLRTGRFGERIGERRWNRADQLLHRHGGRAMFIARFIGFARTLMPRLAGMSGLPYRRFLPWDLLGVVGMVTGTLLVGYLGGRSYATVSGLFGRATSAILLLVLVIAALILVGRYLGRHPDPVADLAERMAAWRPLHVVNTAYRAGFARLTARFGVGPALAAHVVGGALALLGFGYGLALVVDRVVRQSGLPLVDPLISGWVARRREPGAVHAATLTLSVLRGSFLVAFVGVAALALTWRSRVWRRDLAGVLGTVGAFVPLVLIALATDWARTPDSRPHADLLPNQTVIVAASLGMLAWLISRRFAWGWAVAAWTAAVGVVIVVGAARVYVGWSWPSETVASTLLGLLWVLVFVVAWRARDRMLSEPADLPGRSSVPEEARVPADDRVPADERRPTDDRWAPAANLRVLDERIDDRSAGEPGAVEPVGSRTQGQTSTGPGG